MLQRIAAIFLSLLLLSQTLLAGPGASTPLQQAFRHMQQSKLTGWAYDRTTLLNRVTYVEHFDPAAPVGKRWTLASINHLPPTPVQVKTYTAGKNPVTGKPLPKADDGRVRGVVTGTPGNLKHILIMSCVPDTGLQLVSETTDTLTYHYKPDCRALFAHLKQKLATDKSLQKNPDKMQQMQTAAKRVQEIYAHLEGTLTISKVGPYIRSIRLVNSRPFSLMYVVSIKTYHAELDFKRLPSDGPTVLVRNAITFRGRAFIFKNLDEKADISFSGFARATSMRAAP